MPVVIGYVPNPYGEAALEVGLAEAERRGLDVVVVNATRGDAYVDPKFLGDDDRTALETRLAASSVPTRLWQLTGDLSDELIRVAEETSAELLVIGLRRRSPVGKLIMGSVAQRVLLDAPCPVLAVKG